MLAARRRPLPLDSLTRPSRSSYNATRANVMKGMQFLVQSGVPISRPDDFLAEMYKTDEHMAKVKSRILQQQVKIKTFEEKK